MFYLNVTCGLMQVVESPHKKLKRKGIVASKKEILTKKIKNGLLKNAKTGDGNEVDNAEASSAMPFYAGIS